MAFLHTPLPVSRLGHHQEHQLAKRLSALDDSALHLWFDVNYLYAVSDIDLIIWHERVGVFIVEVKGIRLSAITSFGMGSCQIEGREREDTPQKQANSAMYGLKNKLGSRTAPHMTPTVFWPRIARAEWRECWRDNSDVASLADRCLFSDDLAAGAEHLRTRLLTIRETPPIGKGTRVFHHSQSALDDFDVALTNVSEPVRTPSDVQRLAVIESRVKLEVVQQHIATRHPIVIFRGHPGTGKTFRLLELAMAFIQQGRQCLFVCFNKVLAADITRLLSHSYALKTSSVRLDVADLYALLSKHAAPYNISLQTPTFRLDGQSGAADSYDTWATVVIDELRSENPDGMPTYDAIFIDESQDLPSWTMDFLRLFARQDARFFLADAPHQHLYGETPTFLVELRTIAEHVQLRRNFRNTRAGFIAARAYCDLAPDLDRIRAFIGQWHQGSNQMELEFDRASGGAPAVVAIDDSEVWATHEEHYLTATIDLQFVVMVREITTLIRSELEGLADGMFPIDLLILVPDTESMWAVWVRAALDAMPNVLYIDYVSDECRRDIAKREQVRLATYHSSRGIEAHRVLVLGFEQLPKVAGYARASHRDLGYVVLSRSLFQTTIAHLSSRRDETITFVERVVQDLVSRAR